MTLLGNPNGMYSRRVLGWSVGCFLLLSMGLWLANPELFMTDQVAGFSIGDTTRGTIFTGMMFAAIVFLFTWPDGKTAKGLAILGSGLALMMGMRSEVIRTLALNIGSLENSITMTLGLMGLILVIAWIWFIPFLNKKNTDAFDQAPLFGKFEYFLRWSLLALPLMVIYMALKPYLDNPTHATNLLSAILFIPMIYGVCSIVVLSAQSWRIPGFWRKVSLMVFWPVFYFVYSRYTYRAPLSADKTALSNTASPELVHFWNPWTLLNRGMIMAFFTVLLWGQGELIDSEGEHIHFDLAIFDLAIAMIMALHIYAIFQPRAVPYRGLLWCSMIYLILSPALSPDNTDLFSYVSHAISWLSIIWTLQTGYRYRAILEQTTPIPTPPVLSRFWVLSLLGTSLSVGLYSLYWLSTHS